MSGLRKEFKKEGKSKGMCQKKKEDDIKVAVRNGSFSVHTGQVLGLLGPNGAGKTTTLNCVIAEEGASAGTVSLDEYDGSSNIPSYNKSQQLSYSTATFLNLSHCISHFILYYPSAPFIETFLNL